MFIQNMRIDRFGSVSNLALDNLTQDITLIQGGPGTGKTTLPQFARAILYGFDESTRSQCLPSISSVDFGGSITWSLGHHQYTIRRHDDGKLAGHFEVLDDGHPGSRVALTDILQGISADLYSQLFAVDFSRRPEVSELLDEAANCGFIIEGQAIDTDKLQGLVGRLATLQATLATLGPVDESTESLQSRRRELLDDIAWLELGPVRRHDERSQTQSQIEATRGQLETTRQELHALRKAMDEIAVTRQDCRRRFAKAEVASANRGKHETETRELDARIERWKGVLCEAAMRYEEIGRCAPVANCDCERMQLTRVQAELQASLRYLEQERDVLASGGRPPRELPDEITRLKRQYAHIDTKEAELQRGFDAATETIRQKEVNLAVLEQRLNGLTTDSTNRLARHREELQQMEHLLNEIERRQTLEESITETKRQIRQVEEGSGESSILWTATNYLQRISANDFQRIEVTHGRHVWVTDAKGHRLSWGHLSESVRDKVYLSLCLAFVEAHDQRKAPLPLIWKDVFTNFESRQVPEMAELLCSFARDRRQILLLTRHEHVASVFRFKNVPGRTLVATHDWQTATRARHDQQTTHDVNRLLAVAGDAAFIDIDKACAPDDEREVDANFHLFDDSPIEQSPSLSSDNAVRLRRLGITTVSELLEVSGDDIASELSYAGVSGSMVADWKSQALMMCRFARLREYDARILVACGITDPNQLRQIPPIEVRSMIERFADSSEGRAMLLSGTEFELSRIADWVRIGESSDKQRHQQTDNRASQREEERANVVQMKSILESNDLQFYLESTSDVVDAPSIGPRSAERLEAVGVVTVSDLLAADPNELAGRLKNRRMSTKTIVNWQQQTALVCRVPTLRGHDAQILVAVGVTDVEELASMEPQELWTQVGPFVDSSAGKRIIRSSKVPNFEEVFHWIEWAKQARTLNAA